MKNKTMSTLAALFAAMMIASACGSGTSQLGSAPSDSSDTQDPVENPLPDDSDDADGDTAEGDEDSDDDAPASGSGDADVTAENLATIPADDSGSEIVALVDSLHGPTDDVTSVASQLYPFPQVPTQAGAHVMEVSANSSFSSSSGPGLSRVTTEVTVKVDGERPDVVEEFEAAFAPLGWVLDSTEEKSDPPTGQPGTFLSFTRDKSLGYESMTVAVISDAELEAIRLRLRYSASEFPDPDGSIANRFNGWHGDVPLHDSAEPNFIQVGSTWGPGRTKVDLGSTYIAEGLPTEDDEELVQELVDKAADLGVDVEASTSGVKVERDGYENFYVAAGKSQSVRARVLVITPPFDGVKVVGEEKSEDPLPESGATADEIQAIVSDIYGPTADVSAQMQRIGAFPDIPTPNGADIVDLRSGVNNVISFSGNSEDFRAMSSEVEMFIDGEYDDVNAFYDAQLASLGWTEDSNKTEKTDDGLSTVRRVTYDVPEQEGKQINADLTITDDVDDARTKVNLSYAEIVPVADSGLERWASWFGDDPFPEGGELYSAGISTFGFGSSAVFYNVEYLYPDREPESMVSEVESSFGASKFILGDGETFEAGANTKLINPDFVNADLWIWDASTGTRLELGAARRFAE